MSIYEKTDDFFDLLVDLKKKSNNPKKEKIEIDNETVKSGMHEENKTGTIPKHRRATSTTSKSHESYHEFREGTRMKKKSVAESTCTENIVGDIPEQREDIHIVTKSNKSSQNSQELSSREKIFGNDNRGRCETVYRTTDVLSHRINNMQRYTNKFCFQESVPEAQGSNSNSLMFGYKRLQELSEKNINDIFAITADPKSHFQSLFQEVLRPDFFILIMKVLRKVCESEYHELKTHVLTSASNPVFLEQITNYVGKLPGEIDEERKKKIVPFVEDLLIFLTTFINFLPTTAYERLKTMIVAFTISVEGIKQYQKISFTEQTFHDLQILNTKLLVLEGDMKERVMKENSCHCNKLSKPPEDFRGISIIPTFKDLFPSKNNIFLRQNIVKGSYESIDHYLDVQFRLLREDFVAPLREGIQEYIKNLNWKHKINNIKIYPNTRFVQGVRRKFKCGYDICFDTNKRSTKVNWEYSKRFMFGSLLLFSKDNFKTFFMATVLERELWQLRNGNVIVEIVQGTDLPENLFTEEYVMVESEVYFEPYFHVLSALQNMEEDTFPMGEYIVHVNADKCLPEYFENTNFNLYIFDHKVNVLDENSWPSSGKLKLDTFQYDAFKGALTSKFVAIQGPPGTGKTHIGLMIAEILLQNLAKEIKKGEFGPLLVICYTNHALDQFLEGLLPFTENIIRIGGQSRSESLKDYNLREVRRRYQRNNSMNFTQSCIHLHQVMEQVLEAISYHECCLKEVLEFGGILSINILQKFMTSNQREMLLESNFFEMWLIEEIQVINDNKNFQVLGLDNDQWKSNALSNSLSIEEKDDSFVEEAKDADAEQKNENYSFDQENKDDEHNDRLMNDVDYYDIEDEFEISFDVKGSFYFVRLESLLSDIFAQRLKLENMQNEALSDSKKFVTKKEILHEQIIYYQYIKMRLEQICNIDIKFFKNVKNDDLWQLEFTERWKLYRWWVEEYTIFLKCKIQELETEYRKLKSQYEELKQMEDLEFVSKAKVVGITTTGAARVRSMLNKLKAKVVIVEEAAEVLEAHIVTSISKDCEHVILIGDHEQLRPSTAVYKLSKQYNMDISLFERMLKNGLSCYKLGVQHRMRPEIASLIVPSIYRELENHPSVENRSNIKGITHNLFFVTHTHLEDEVPDSASRRNRHEADFMIALCRYLLLQGYSANEITILATYSGQMQYMSRERKKNELLRDVRITVVDKYQGEENKIILLSLVRSNKLGKIGFLSTKNRVCVALSRARDGLYIIGNMSNLEDSAIWHDIKGQLEKGNHLGPDLTLRCEVHQNYLTRVRQASDFMKVPEGGCDQICDEELVCGHRCVNICHILDREHGKYKCNFPCIREICQIEDHSCPKLCHQDCGLCQKLVWKNLSCGHSAEMPCYRNPEEQDCTEMVDAVLPFCGHKITKQCFMDINAFNHCSYPCEDRLPCGHKCSRDCHKLNDPDHLMYKCMRDCARNDLVCSNNHKCNKHCYEECGECTMVLPKEFPCGHFDNILCNKDVNSILCSKRCKKILPCGHPCKLECYKECGDCKERVDKILPDCNHIQKCICSEAPNPKKCSRPCNRKLKCGHPCNRKCNQDCNAIKCLQIVTSPAQSPCGHQVNNFHCYMIDDPLELPLFCKEPCRKTLPCGHECEGDCSRCIVLEPDVIHAPCRKKCVKRLICGHMCNALCQEICPPCNQKCLNSCEHRSCTKRCGDFCNPCDKKCNRSCPHIICNKKCSEICNISKDCDESCTNILECGHACTGLCGELCPTCPICTSRTYSVNIRYLQLEDCKCIIDVKKVDLLFYNGLLMPNIGIKCCPNCQKPIIKTKRYKPVVLRTLKDIGHIKKKITSQFLQVTQNGKMLLRSIQENYILIERSDIHELVGSFVQTLKSSLSNAKFLNIQPTKYYAVMIVAETFNNVLLAKDTHLLCSLVRILEQRLEYINQNDITLLNTVLYMRSRKCSYNMEISDSFLRNTIISDLVWVHCRECEYVISSWENSDLECYHCGDEKQETNIPLLRERRHGHLGRRRRRGGRNQRRNWNYTRMAE